jgi:mannose-1-phosphate guanylyltransferase
MLGIIMAGGQGTRLMPLTQTRPKPMVEVLGRPVIDYVKDAMVRAGITEIVVTTGYRGEQLRDHINDWNGTFPDERQLKARVNQEATPMGTAGSVGLLREQINGTCVVGSGDAVASFDIRDLLEKHRASGAKVTMALWEVDDPSEFGIVGLASGPEGMVDGDLREGYIRRFKEKPTPEEAFSSVINAGLYILEPEVFEHIPAGEKFDFSKQLFPKLLEMGWPMYASAINGVWYDVGHPFELLNAQRTLMERVAELPFEFPPDFSRQGNSLVASSSAIQGHHQQSVFGHACHLHESAVFENSLVMDGGSIGAASVVKGSVLGRNVHVGSSCRIEGCVIGDGVTIEDGEHVFNQRISDNS